MQRMLIVFVLVAALSGCEELSLATKYVGNEPQSFDADIPGIAVKTLRVYRDADRPGKLWVQPNAKRQTAMAFAGRQTQFTAMLKDTVEPAYRAAALEALKMNPGGACGITSYVPWPTQFAIEFAYRCE